ncbi:MAG: tRNA (5-methylaminomethyl-2-thiouridine)(34)-methyltransferase MnmD [Bacteroidales bacterium]|jgi:tRNA U34 5-methylaminomethyl-2-thiouridine-forming methyltransferase MnmC|nr:tRNA (5-methylaminomethyl-2-thiouridine)(34)-methyltransferase MnmD [Bacteroidales bacterium]
MKRHLVITEDDSSSFYDEEVNQYYHSHFGALQESLHIFINAGLCSEYLSHLAHISILELGFGTGLNALLTYFKAEEMQKKIYYETLELYPLTPKEAAQLNYPNILDYENVKEIFTTLSSTPWDENVVISEHFTLNKRQISAIGAQYSPHFFNLVYFDPFSPDVQPELWTKAVFESIFNSMSDNAILLTYCTKGTVKEVMRKIGFEIEKLPGPAGKREILRGRKI